MISKASAVVRFLDHAPSSAARKMPRSRADSSWRDPGDMIWLKRTTHPESHPRPEPVTRSTSGITRGNSYLLGLICVDPCNVFRCAD